MKLFGWRSLYVLRLGLTLLEWQFEGGGGEMIWVVVLRREVRLFGWQLKAGGETIRAGIFRRGAKLLGLQFEGGGKIIWVAV